MPVAEVWLSDLLAGVLAQLRTGFPANDVHDGEVKSPSLIGDDQGPGGVEGDAAIQPYAVVWSAPGDQPYRALDGWDGGGEHRIYVTVAASTPTICLDTADRARRLLDGATITVPGSDGPHVIDLQWLTAYYPPPPAKDTDVSPHRWFIPLIFTALI